MDTIQFKAIAINIESEISELRKLIAAEEHGVAALQTANSRYVTALGVLQDFYEWAGRVEPNGFETWCKQRLNAEEPHCT